VKRNESVAVACQAARALTRVPGYAAVAVVTLGLGIGATVAIYTVVEHILLEPMPYPESDRLVRVKSPVPGSGTDDEWETSTAEYFYFREHAPPSTQLRCSMVARARCRRRPDRFACTWHG
jgi:hypothetical protein